MRKKKELPNADLNVLENKAVEDYYNMGAADWLPPTEARDLARQPYVLYPEHYPNAEGGVKDLNELVKTYGLDKRTTPYTNMEAYQRLAGEAEARATQARMNMTMPERLKIFPFDSYDVPKEQLIIRGLLGGF
jgi:hypothetical protein